MLLHIMIAFAKDIVVNAHYGVAVELGTNLA